MTKNVRTATISDELQGIKSLCQDVAKTIDKLLAEAIEDERSGDKKALWRGVYLNADTAIDCLTVIKSAAMSELSAMIPDQK